MKIKCNNRILADKVEYCKTIFQRARGAMFRPYLDRALIFPVSPPGRVSLHMFFVFFPIDVLFIRDNKIIEMKKQFLPFTLYNPKQNADTIIEFPADTIKNIKIGDKISINN
ncbi:DUF192 domain-containing protein [Candidatus Woesearchaeota archaeon]|nr:DUF192 domain-containing protein [Candidatus Woesearchaeota archaeon]